jgi:hypothetical protein
MPFGAGLTIYIRQPTGAVSASIKNRFFTPPLFIKTLATVFLLFRSAGIVACIGSCSAHGLSLAAVARRHTFYREFNVLNIIQLARYVTGLAWIYHGLFPKLLQIAPLEQAMAGSLGLPEEFTYLLVKAASVGEVLFGVAFIWLYRSRVVLLLNLAGLIGLLAFVAVARPHILLEAFNPVTTNIPLMVLGYILLQQRRDRAYADNG